LRSRYTKGWSRHAATLQKVFLAGRRRFCAAAAVAGVVCGYRQVASCENRGIRLRARRRQSGGRVHQGTTGSDASLEQVTSAARAELAKSGRYTMVDTRRSDDKSVLDKTLRNCDGCEAEIAQKLGADQSMIGVVKRATQTDYYIFVQIRDARTGKVLDQQGANFAGDEVGWPSGRACRSGRIS
jgi:hypothetical protein